MGLVALSVADIYMLTSRDIKHGIARLLFHRGSKNCFVGSVTTKLKELLLRNEMMNMQFSTTHQMLQRSPRD